MNEAETRAELIDPALAVAGWGKVDGSRVRREVITIGRLTGGGKRGQQDIADYVLVYRGQKLAVIEAKRAGLPDTKGVGQAKRYAAKLQTRFAYSTNGIGIYCIDMETGGEDYVDAYPTSDELWNRTFAEPSLWRDRFAQIPFEDRGGSYEARYYQHNAINQTLKAIAEVKLLINAEKSDLFDVLAYIAFAFAPISRTERVSRRKDIIFEHYADKQQRFLSFVLGHYIDQGVGELDQEKLPDLLALKYHSMGDAMTELGSAAEIREVFVGF